MASISLASAKGLDKLGNAAVSAFSGFLSLFLFFRLLIYRRKPKVPLQHLLTADKHGFVLVDSKGIVTIAEQAALSGHGVIESEVTVLGEESGPISLKADIGVHPGANVKQAGDETRELVRETVQEIVGIEVRDVTVAVHVLEPNELTRLMR